ncbi:MAG: hypothetical protein AB1507_07180 [Bacillota bacterium]|nr:hypothetical protein [Thermoanaerobacteraceae bacterium]
MEKVAQDIIQKFMSGYGISAAQLKFYYADPDVTERYSFGNAGWSQEKGWVFNLKPPTGHVNPQKAGFTDLEREICDSYLLALRSAGNPYNQLPPEGVPLDEWAQDYQKQGSKLEAREAEGNGREIPGHP